MQKNLNQKYSKLAVPIKSKGRIFFEPTNMFRTPYQRDRDRVVHSTAFRRLKHKTQVFVNTTGDHYRTRMTHSIEVAQIARTLARYFNLNEDLCETLSLAHDLGHTPFGHAGEEVLNDCMSNYGGFDHNLQTLRIVTLLENKYYKFDGLNLTFETLDGLIKHNGPVAETDEIKKILGKKFKNNKLNFNNYHSLEEQLAAISDDIAYNSHDLEDGLRAGLYKLADLEKISGLSLIIKKHKKNIRLRGTDLVIRQIIRDTINMMVNDIIKKKMYFSKEVFAKTNLGKKIIKFLFDKVKKKPNKFFKKNTNNNESLERQVSDFIAGMTDRYAINLYDSLK